MSGLADEDDHTSRIVDHQEGILRHDHFVARHGDIGCRRSRNAVVLIRGPAIVNQYEISIPGTPTAPQIAAAYAALLTLGILVR